VEPDVPYRAGLIANTPKPDEDYRAPPRLSILIPK
jgi:hypothetical protein